MTSKCKCHLYILPFGAVFLITSACLIYIIGFCVFIIHNLLESILYISFLSILYILLLWSFFSTVFTPVATVPSKFKLTDEEIELLKNCEDVNKKVVLDRIFHGKDLILYTRYPAGCIRYCLKCKHIKPDRARHCSSCGVCVLKMDHHCPWINNCVGFSNYKSFMLFLIYLALYCFYILGTSAKYLLKILVKEEGQIIVVGLFIATFFGIFAVTMLVFHCTLILKNDTSIDKLQKPIFEIENSTFDLGCYNNFIEIFGENWRLWPFPVLTSLGTGYTFSPRILNYSNV